MDDQELNNLRYAERDANAWFNERLAKGETEEQYREAALVGYLRATIRIAVSNEEIRRRFEVKDTF